MKILYGVVGEGMGHAMRSWVVLEHLLAEGHELTIMASSRAHDFLAKRFSGVNRIRGLHIIYEHNRVRRGKTLWSNVLAGLDAIPQNIAAYFDLLREHRPDCVISDFESWAYLFGKNHRLPTFSIDNMQVINRCEHADEIRAGHEAEFQLTKAFVKGKLPFCDHYLVTTFFFPPVRKERTTLVPPVLRPEILAASPSRGDHLLVYQTADGNERLEALLKQTAIECRVYGLRRDLAEEQIEGNVRFRPFSENGFIADLASARAVLAGGGFTLMSEAVYLHKPLLSIPVGQQFEQVLNARYLEREEYGRCIEQLDDPTILRDFLDALPRYEDHLAKYAQAGNQLLYDALDHQLDRVGAGVV